MVVFFFGVDSLGFSIYKIMSSANIVLHRPGIVIGVVAVGIEVDLIAVLMQSVQKGRGGIGFPKISGTRIVKIVFDPRNHIGNAWEGAGIEREHIVKIGKAVKIVKDLGAFL